MWVPRHTGINKIKVNVAALNNLRAATSETKSISVKPKATGTSIGTISCGTVCVNGIPLTLNLDREEVITAGITSGFPKARKVHFQTLRTTNLYKDQTSATSSWQSDINKYGIALSFSEIDSFSDCTPGDTFTWNFRFYVDANSKSPAAATQPKWITIVCPTSGNNSGDISMVVTYSDQYVDYYLDNPDTVHVSVTALDSAQYSIYSETCLKTLDCNVYDNWVWNDGYYKSDNIFGSREFDLMTDPGDYGDYWFRVEIYPWTNQDSFYSELYTLNLN
jgi:hypothetical protein